MKTVQLCVLLLFVTISSPAQPYNSEIINEDTPYLLGKINQEALTRPAYSEWFLSNRKDYRPNPEIINTLKKELGTYTITVFMGTWCGDSKREVPRFYKILNEAQFPMERLTTVAVGQKKEIYKQSPGGEQEGLNIHRVPTFIFYKEGKEINRIVEHPVHSLEKDMMHILNSNYIPNYNGVTMINTALHQWGVEKFRKKSNKLVSKIQDVVSSFYELNTFSYVLMTSGKEEEAIAVAEFNVKLYPQDIKSYKALANRFKAYGKNQEAMAQYQKALRLDPGNKELIHTLDSLKKQDIK
ncbi:MAG: hypothetical protein AAFZ89_11420 [Bacteroidota bacterium]